MRESVSLSVRAIVNKMRIEDFKEHKCRKIPEGYSVETAIFNSGKSEWVWSVINHDYFDNSVHSIFCCPFCGQELGSAEPDGNLERGYSKV